MDFATLPLDIALLIAQSLDDESLLKLSVITRSSIFHSFLFWKRMAHTIFSDQDINEYILLKGKDNPSVLMDGASSNNIQKSGHESSKDENNNINNNNDNATCSLGLTWNPQKRFYFDLGAFKRNIVHFYHNLRVYGLEWPASPTAVRYTSVIFDGPVKSSALRFLSQGLGCSISDESETEKTTVRYRGRDLSVHTILCTSWLPETVSSVSYEPLRKALLDRIGKVRVYAKRKEMEKTKAEYRNVANRVEFMPQSALKPHLHLKFVTVYYGSVCVEKQLTALNVPHFIKQCFRKMKISGKSYYYLWDDDRFVLWRWGTAYNPRDNRRYQILDYKEIKPGDRLVIVPR